MQLDRAPVKRALEDDRPIRSDRVQLAAILILIGSACQVFRIFMPWVERAVFTVSVATFDVDMAATMLVVVAVITAVIGIFVLLRPPPATLTAIVLVLLALAQLGFAVWNSLSILGRLRLSHHVWADAIGTGMYLVLIGALISLAGAALTWTNRAGAVASR